MISRLVTFAKVKLHPTSSIIRSDVHWVMTHLIFVPKVKKIRKWHSKVLTNLYCGYFIMKNNSATFYLTCDHFSDMARLVLAKKNLVFVGKWPMLNMLLMLSTYTTSNDKRIPLITPHWESKQSLILEPRSTPSSTPILMITNSLVMIRNWKHDQVSNAWIHRLDDSTWLEMPTLAHMSSTIPQV